MSMSVDVLMGIFVDVLTCTLTYLVHILTYSLVIILALATPLPSVYVREHVFVLACDCVLCVYVSYISPW